MNRRGLQPRSSNPLSPPTKVEGDKNENRRTELLWIGGLCVLALAAWIAFRLYTGIVIEDAWITYRYAKNLALGNGFVYNVGEHVLGTTSPLTTLLLALLGKVFGMAHPEMLSNLVMLPAGLAAGVLTYLVLKKLALPKWLPIFWLIVYFFHFNTLWSVTGGLETPLVILLMAATLYALVQQKSLWAAGWASLLVLTRVDGAIWAVGIYLLILLSHRRDFWKALLIGVLIVGPWVIFAFAYFGSPIPNTVIAKSLIGQMDDYSSSWTMVSYFGWVLLYLSRISPFGRIAGFAFVAIGGWAVFRRYRSPLLKLVFVFPFAFGLAYYVGHAPKFPWYLLPLSWCGMIIGSIGLWEAGRLLRDMTPGDLATPRRVRWAVALFFVVYGLALFNRDVTTTAFHYHWQKAESGVRTELGLWLRNHTPSDASVLMEAIGYQGYFSERRIVDLAGLISPQVVQWHRESASNAETLYKILNNEQPDYVVLRSYEADENKHFFGGALFDTEEQKDYFTAHYHEAKRFSGGDEQVGGRLFRLTIFGRVDTTFN